MVLAGQRCTSVAVVEEFHGNSEGEGNEEDGQSVAAASEAEVCWVI